MNRLCLVISLLILLSSRSLLAADFVAGVADTAVNVGQGFQLYLSVKGAKAEGKPDFSVLERDFTIYGSSQSSQTIITNGDITSSKTWTLTLIPNQKGKLTIPSLSIKTNHGVLKSDPIIVHADTSSATKNAPDSGSDKAVYTEIELNKKTVYTNEPVLITARLVAYQNSNDISLEDPVVDGAIIERLGEPKVDKMMVGGRMANVIEVQYLLTPLAAGELTIPGPMFKGQIESASSQRHFSDPFDMMRNFNGFSHFSNFQPFAITALAKTLNIKPAVNAIQPWLPAAVVTLSQQWQGLDTAKVGEPITRQLTISAQGLAAAALPSLKAQVEETGDFKLYADKPVLDDQFNSASQTINSTRQESYTLIPQKAGELQLPEIKLPWWNVNQEQLTYASIPAKTIHIEQGEVSQNNDAVTSSPSSDQTAPQSKATDSETTQLTSVDALPNWVVPVVTVLTLVLVIMFIILIILWKRLSVVKDKTLNQPTTSTENNQEESQQQAKVSIDKATTLSDLQTVIQQFAMDKFAMPATSSLKKIDAVIQQQYDDVNSEVLVKIEASLYQKSSETIDVGALQAEVKSLLKTLSKKVKNTKPKMTTPCFEPLNPS